MIDPIFNRSLAELDMLGEVGGKRRGVAQIKLKVPVPNYPGGAELGHRIRAAIKDLGVTIEVVPEPMNDQQRGELMSSLRDTAGPGVTETGSPTRVIAVGSGKGGVGKSSVTNNLAVALVNAGNRVGVMDADIWGFSIPKMLGIRHAPIVLEQSIIPPRGHGVQAISMDYFVGEDQAVIWRGPMLHKAVEQFLTDVFWDTPDFLLVDMPPGTGDISISLSQFLPRAQVLLVTTPQPTAQRVAQRAGAMAKKVEQEVIGVVENMSWFVGEEGTEYRLFGEGGGEELAESLSVPLLGKIPFQPEMRIGADEGYPVLVNAPECAAAQAFRDLAGSVITRRPRVRTHPDLVIK